MIWARFCKGSALPDPVRMLVALGLTAMALVATAGQPPDRVSKEFSISFDSEQFVDYGDVRITQADVDAFLERVPANRRADVLTDLDRVGRILTNIYLTDVFQSLAEQEGLLEKPEVQARLYRAIMVELRDLYRERFLESVELNDYSTLAREIYLSRPDEFMGPQRIDFKHILVHVGRGGDEVEAMSRILDLYRKVRDGADFLELARKHSDDPSVAENGGLFEQIDSSDLVDQVAAVLGQARVGQLAAPVRSRFGWHLVQLVAVHPREQLSWEQSQRRAESMARDRHRHESYERLLRDVQDHPFEFAEGAVARLLARYGLEMEPGEDEGSIGDYLKAD